MLGKHSLAVQPFSLQTFSFEQIMQEWKEQLEEILKRRCVSLLLSWDSLVERGTFRSSLSLVLQTPV